MYRQIMIIDNLDIGYIRDLMVVMEAEQSTPTADRLLQIVKYNFRLNEQTKRK